MTNLEALQASVLYPVKVMLLTKVLLDRGLLGSDDYVFVKQRLVDLAVADIYCKLIGSPNISEGGISISIADKASLMKAASSIYVKYGESDPYGLTPSVGSVSPW